MSNPPIAFQEDCTGSGHLSAQEPHFRKLSDLKEEGRKLFLEAMAPWEAYFGVSARVLGMHGFVGAWANVARFEYKGQSFSIHGREHPVIDNCPIVHNNVENKWPYTPQQLLFAMIAQIENRSIE